MVIYLDVVLFENFVINFFLLYITVKLMKFKLIKKRIIIASLIGTVYTITMIFPTIKFLSVVPFQILIAVIMMKISIDKAKFREVVKGTISFIFSSLLLAGVCFKLSEISDCYNIFSKATKFNISCQQVIISTIIVYLIISTIYDYFKDRACIYNFIYDVEIIINKKKYLIRAFLDTGNSLTEPVTNLPCILVENRYFDDFLCNSNDYYLVPYSAVGFSGMIKGFKSDIVRIKSENGTWREIKALICPCDEIFSSNNDYNALLSRGII